MIGTIKKKVQQSAKNALGEIHVFVIYRDRIAVINVKKMGIVIIGLINSYLIYTINKIYTSYYTIH